MIDWWHSFMHEIQVSEDKAMGKCNPTFLYASLVIKSSWCVGQLVMTSISILLKYQPHVGMSGEQVHTNRSSWHMKSLLVFFPNIFIGRILRIRPSDYFDLKSL